MLNALRRWVRRGRARRAWFEIVKLSAFSSSIPERFNLGVDAERLAAIEQLLARVARLERLRVPDAARKLWTRRLASERCLAESLQLGDTPEGQAAAKEAQRLLGESWWLGRTLEKVVRGAPT
jgi:hypothetical protein